MHRLTWPGGRLAVIAAVIDGSGGGGTTGTVQDVRATVFDAAGELVVQSAYVGVLKDQGTFIGVPRPLSFPLASPLTLPAGVYYVGIEATGSTATQGRVVRVYGDSMAAPSYVNLCPNPRHLDTTAGYTKLYVGLNTSSVVQVAGGGVRGTVASAALGGPYYASAAITGGSPINPRRDISVVPGRTYCAGAIFTSIATGRSVRAQMIYRDASGANLASGVSTGTTVLGSANTTSGISVCSPTVAPTGAVTLAITFYRLAGGSAATGDTVTVPFWAAYEADAFPGFFDGSMAGWSWDGDANASISRGPYASVNVSPYGSMESTEVTASTASAENATPTGRVVAPAGTTLVADTVTRHGGARSLRVEQTATGSPVQCFSPSAPPGSYASAVWVLAPAGLAMRFDACQQDGSVIIQDNFTGTGAWQRRMVSFVTDTAGAGWKLRAPVDAVATFWVDDSVVGPSISPSPSSRTAIGGALPLETAFTPTGTPGASTGLLALAGPEQLRSSTTLVLLPGAAQMPGTMNVTMGQDLAAADAQFDATTAATGSGALALTLAGILDGATTMASAGTLSMAGAGGALAGSSAASGSGALSIAGSAAFLGSVDFAGSGALQLAGRSSMTAETVAAGAGGLLFAVAGVLAGESRFDGSGRVGLAGAGGALAGGSYFEGAGAQVLALAGALSAEGGISGDAGALVVALAAAALEAAGASSGSGVLRIAQAAALLEAAGVASGTGALRLVLAGILDGSGVAAGHGTLIRGTVSGGIITRSRTGTAGTPRARTGTAAIPHPRTGTASR